MQGHAALSHPSHLSTYHRLVRRVNRAITTPRAQRERQANLAREPGDQPDDWDRLLDEIQQADGVAMTRRNDGSVYVTWRSLEPEL
ncbi:DUF1654 domain-containing protein [Stutzerimonas decontaminans]|uniref:DUF1654 domain-containing protein n=1 Tax=Stutzerimonas stutzeri TaxID=316 RepID=A0A023WVK3_STUST|nr:DUF1654 domain-containing protein [Stutzerimonas decontaminans]AHY43844.1 hypothetical protein UIB01_15710 [Stutzerimonas decontaminans]